MLVGLMKKQFTFLSISWKKAFRLENTLYRNYVIMWKCGFRVYTFTWSHDPVGNS